MSENMSPRLEAWTRFAENALNGILASTEDVVPTENAVRLASEYASAMTEEWMRVREKFRADNLRAQGI